MIFLKLFLLFFSSFAQTATTLSHFQSEIKNCLPELKNINGLKSHSGLYSAIQGQFLLSNEQNLYREIVFKKKDRDYKLKVIQNEIELFEITEDGRIKSIPIELRQKEKTKSAIVLQVVENSPVSFEWQKTLETREGSLSVEIVRKNGKMEQISIENRKTKQKLDCNTLNDSEICICHK